jgi:hypothetical protein
MRVAVFALYAAEDVAFGTDLEIIEQHLAAQDDVTVVICQAELSSCDRNPLHILDYCIRCMRKSHRGLGLLRQPVTQIPVSYLPKWAEETEASQVESYENTDHLQEWQVGAFDVGSAIASSLITWKRDADATLQENYELLRKLADVSLRLYRGVAEWLPTEKIDRVYVFNGRYAPMRAIVRACQQRHVDVYTHDRGCNLQHYALFENTLPHDRELFRRNAESAWVSADKTRRTQVAAEWYHARAKGGPVGAWASFISEQSEGQMPVNWESAKGRRISAFTSSGHEFAAVGPEWKNELFDSQLEGLKYVISDLQNELANEQIHLFVRIHPNQGNAHTSEEANLLALACKGVTVIPARSDVSTYRLMKESDAVLTFGSTTGIEATFWGVPAILAGQSYYRPLGGAYIATSKDHLLSLLKTDLEPKGKEAALKYAYYMATYGTKYDYFQANDFKFGKFKDHELENFAEEYRKVREAYETLKARHENVEEAYEKLQVRHENVKEAYEKLKAGGKNTELSEAYGSTSWRITAPLRVAKSATSRIVKRMKRQKE